MKLEDIKEIAVVGAGTMGPGIAIVFARSGYNVKMYSRRKETLDKAQSVMRSSLNTLFECDIIKKEDIDAILSRITTTDNLEEAVKNADFISETVAEKKDTKKEIFEQLDKLCPEKTIFSSNTSSLNAFDVMPKNRLKNSFMVHWFFPAHIVPVVEVVCAPEVSNETRELTVALLKKVNATPVVMEKFIPGFVVNRLYRALGREIFFLLDNGYMNADQLDLAGKLALGARMMILGLVKRYDYTGLDISANNLKNPDFIDPPLDNRPKSLFDLVEKGDLGIKTGKGFFDYSGKKLEEIIKKRDRDLIKIYKSTAFTMEEEK